MTVRPSVDSVTANACIQASVREGDVLQHVLCSVCLRVVHSSGAERQDPMVVDSRGSLVHILGQFFANKD